MAVAFPNLSWWLWSGKHQEPRITNGSSLNTKPDSDLWESKFPLFQRANVASSSRRVKRKWHSREERKKIDREYDAVLVPSDGDCVSGSESDDSDYSIGWLEPHGPGFQSDDDDADNTFAVLVPCYGHVQEKLAGDSKNMFAAVVNIPDESKKYMEEWLSSLRS